MVDDELKIFYAVAEHGRVNGAKEAMSEAMSDLESLRFLAKESEEACQRQQEARKVTEETLWRLHENLEHAQATIAYLNAECTSAFLDLYNMARSCKRW